MAEEDDDIDNEFEEEIFSVQDAILVSVDDVHVFDFQMACDMETTAEVAYQAIASARREAENRECDCDVEDCSKPDTANEVDHKDGWYKFVQVVSYNNTHETA